MNDDKLTRQAKQLLDESVTELDEATCRRLQQARQRAMSAGKAAKAGSRGRWWLWGAVPTMATALLLLILWPKPEPATKGLLPVAEMLEAGLLTMEEPLDFYQEEIEFYVWLEDVLEADQTYVPAPDKLGVPVTGAGRIPAALLPASAGSAVPGPRTARIPRSV